MISHVRIIKKPDYISYEDVCGVIQKAYENAYRTIGVKINNTSLTGARLEERIDRGSCFTAMVDGRVVGTLSTFDENLSSWFYSGRVLRIRYVAVLPEFQGMHVASMLVKTAISYALNKEIEVVVLSTSEKNKPAIKLYENGGFQLIDVSRDKGFTENAVRLVYWMNGCPINKMFLKLKYLERKIKCFVKAIIKW